MVTEVEYLDIDLAIGVTEHGDIVKATSYFEDYLYKFVQVVGGEGGDTIDNSTNLITVNEGDTRSLLSLVSKRLNALEQRQPDDSLLSRINTLQNKNAPDLDDLSWQPRLSLISKEINALKQRQPDDSLLSRINELVKQNSKQEQLIAQLLSEITQLSSIVNQQSAGSALVIQEKSADYTQSKFDDLIVMSGANTVTLIDPALAFKYISIRNDTGSLATVTITPAGGTTTEVTSLTDGQATILAPVGTEWIVAH